MTKIKNILATKIIVLNSSYTESSLLWTQHWKWGGPSRPCRPASYGPVNYENFHWHNNFGRLLNKYLKLIPIIIDIGIRKASSIPKNIKPLLNSEASKLLQWIFSPDPRVECTHTLRWESWPGCSCHHWAQQYQLTKAEKIYNYIQWNHVSNLVGVQTLVPFRLLHCGSFDQ